MKVELTLTGTRPLLMNNAQLANPMNPWARQLRALTSKRKKTDEDLLLIMQAEARGGCYEAPGELLGWPTENTWRSLHQAATAFKLGEALKRALRYEPTTEPLLIGGGEVTIDAFLDTPGNIDYRSAKPPAARGRVMRSRPIARDWSCEHVFELDETALDPSELGRIVERAGSYVGLGNWRPTYGTFTGKAA